MPRQGDWVYLHREGQNPNEVPKERYIVLERINQTVYCGALEDYDRFKRAVKIGISAETLERFTRRRVATTAIRWTPDKAWQALTLAETRKFATGRAIGK